MSLVDVSIVRLFASLFPGRYDVWGALHGEAIKERLTLTHFRRHLEGRVSLGIYPLRRDGAVKWFAGDIDRNEPEHALGLAEAFRQLGLTSGVYVERSKGKGFHVLVLLDHWLPARDVRLAAKEALRIAGLPVGTEVFPKQDRLTDETPWGNYLNLPYFGGDNPQGRRMIINPLTLAPWPLEDWLASVQLFPTDALPHVLDNLPDADRGKQSQAKNSPGDILELLLTTHASGSRRPGVVRLAGYLRVRGVPEHVAVALLLPWARQHNQPSLADAEIERHIQGIYRRYGVRSVGDLSAVDPGEIVSLDDLPAHLDEALWEIWR